MRIELAAIVRVCAAHRHTHTDSSKGDGILLIACRLAALSARREDRGPPSATRRSMFCSVDLTGGDTHCTIAAIALPGEDVCLGNPRML